MTLSDQQDKIGVGWDVVLGSLTLLTSITVGSSKIFGPEVIRHYNPGIYKIQGDGIVKTLGYKSVKWVFGILPYDQWAYLSTTYCGGGVSGKVTVYTNLGTATYTRLNAIMILPVPDTMQGKNWYQNAPVELTRLAPAA